MAFAIRKLFIINTRKEEKRMRNYHNHTHFFAGSYEEDPTPR